MVTHAGESSSLVLGSQQALICPLAMACQTPNPNSHIQRNGIRNQNAEEGDSVVIRNEWAREPHEGPDFQVMQNWFPSINRGTVDRVNNFFPNTQGDQRLTFASVPPTSCLNFNMSMDRLHCKAYIGWLKLKAALKWGISVRKVAAARRARVEKLED